VGLGWVDLILKIPVLLVILAVWWAIRHAPQEPPPASDDDGGIHRDSDRIHPHRPFPRPPRRGPHGDPPAPSPRRVRTVKARARMVGH
jgi:hypothetical protein